MVLLVMTFNARWSPEVEAVEPSLVTWEIQPIGEACKLTFTHEGLTPGNPLILSSLKTFIETGKPLKLEGG